jgi:hypothetical protein
MNTQVNLKIEDKFISVEQSGLIKINSSDQKVIAGKSENYL